MELSVFEGRLVTRKPAEVLRRRPVEAIGEGVTVLLLTGRPGVGKTTLLRGLVARYRGTVGGFYTEEVREHGTRLGFDMVTLEGRRVPLARVGFRGRHRVSKYGVDVEALERVGVEALREALRRDALVVVGRDRQDGAFLS